MNEFGKDLGVVHEAVVTGREVGATKEFWATLAHSKELFAKVVAFVTEALKLVFNLTPTIDRDMTGWTCVEPAQTEEGEFELVLQEFLQERETSVGGEEMVKRAKKQGVNTGLRHLEAILREQDKIPAEMRQFCLVSTEVWLSPGGYRRVWCLYWDDGRWVLGDDCWLSSTFYSGYRLVASRKYRK